MKNLQLLDDGSSENICNEKYFSITNNFLKRQNRILKDLIVGQLTSVISIFNKSQKPRKIQSINSSKTNKYKTIKGCRELNTMDQYQCSCHITK